jgi:hypothetical protein
MLADYERGNMIHVLGDHAVLEKSLRRFPVREPHDLTDASYWSWYDLRGRYLRGVVGAAFEAGWSHDAPPLPNPDGIEHYRRDPYAQQQPAPSLPQRSNGMWRG